MDFKNNIGPCACWITLVVCDSFQTVWTIAFQPPPSMGLPIWEHWSVLPFPSPKNYICVCIYKCTMLLIWSLFVCLLSIFLVLYPLNIFVFLFETKESHNHVSKIPRNLFNQMNYRCIFITLKCNNFTD